MRRTEIDGVPVFWTGRRGGSHARLLFGVGLAHEAFLETGITHLVARLATRTGRCTGSAEALHTTFEAPGGPEAAAERLRRVCLALGDLDTGPLDRDRGGLLAEEREMPDATAWLPSALWFGNRAFGLAGNVRLAAGRVEPGRVREWATRWFHRGNAALVLSGPPPAGLTLPLPDGPRTRSRPSAEPFELPTPAYTTVTNGVVGCALVEWTAETACAAGILIERLGNRLRCDVAFDHQRVDARRAVVGFGADVGDRHARRVVEVIRAELAGLAADGPTDDELELDRAGLAEQIRGPDFAVYRAFDAALSELTGFPPAAEHQRGVLAGLAPAAVASAARDLASQLVLGAPDRAVPRDLPELPGSPVPPPSGREVKRALVGSTSPRAHRLVVGDDGLTTYFGPTSVPAAVVRFDDLAGVGIEHTDGRLPILHLFGGHGGAITVRPGDWRGGRTLVRQLRARVDPAVCFETPESMRMFEQS